MHLWSIPSLGRPRDSRSYYACGARRISIAITVTTKMLACLLNLLVIASVDVRMCKTVYLFSRAGEINVQYRHHHRKSFSMCAEDH